MNEELQPGNCRIKCGIHNVQMPVVGRTAGELKMRLKDMFNIAPNVQLRINGTIVDSGYVMCDKDELEFVIPQGEKASDLVVVRFQGQPENCFPGLSGKSLTEAVTILCDIYKPCQEMHVLLNGLNCVTLLPCGNRTTKVDCRARHVLVLKSGDVIEFIHAPKPQGETMNRPDPNAPVTAAYLE